MACEWLVVFAIWKYFFNLSEVGKQWRLRGEDNGCEANHRTLPRPALRTRPARRSCLMLTQPHSPSAFLRSSNTWRKLLLKLSFCWKYRSRIFYNQVFKKNAFFLVGKLFCQSKHLSVEARCGHASQLFADTTCFNVKLAKIPERSFQQSLGDQFSLSTEECNRVETFHEAKLSGHSLGGRGRCKSMTGSRWWCAAAAWWRRPCGPGRRGEAAVVACMAPGGPSCGPSEPARPAGGAVPCNGHVSFVKHL